MGALWVQALSRQGHPTAEGCVLGASSSPILVPAPREAGGGCLDAEQGIPCLVDPASHKDSPRFLPLDCSGRAWVFPPASVCL